MNDIELPSYLTYLLLTSQSFKINSSANDSETLPSHLWLFQSLPRVQHPFICLVRHGLLARSLIVANRVLCTPPTQTLIATPDWPAETLKREKNPASARPAGSGGGEVKKNKIKNWSSGLLGLVGHRVAPLWLPRACSRSAAPPPPLLLAALFKSPPPSTCFGIFFSSALCLAYPVQASDLRICMSSPSSHSHLHPSLPCIFPSSRSSSSSSSIN